MIWVKNSDHGIKCGIWFIARTGLQPNCRYTLFEHEPPRVTNKIHGVFASAELAKAAARRRSTVTNFVPEE